MRVYLSGQKAFGAAALKLLLEQGHTVVGVSAPAFKADGETPDRLRGWAEHHRIPWQPDTTLRADTLPDGVDLIVAAHSHAFIGRATRHKAKLGAIGYHPSLLPRHRGRDAVRWTLRDGDPIAGGTVFWLSDNVDAGDIAAQDWCWVRPGDTADSLWRRDLFPLGLTLLAQVLTDISSGRLVRLPQDEEVATWEPSWERSPLKRPDLLLLGPIPGYTVIRERPRG